jgi:hypothetical protein
MKKSTIVIAGMIFSVSFAIAYKIAEKLEEKKQQDEIDEFWNQEHIQTKIEEVENDAIELTVSLNAEADEYLTQFKQEINQMMDEYSARQEELQNT